MSAQNGTSRAPMTGIGDCIDKAMPVVEASTKALIFDLFGTLVDNFSFQRHELALTEMAALLDASRDDFALWYGERTGWGRITGEFASVEANIEYVCAQLGINPDPARVFAAARVTLDFTRELLIPRDGAVEMLTEAKAMGYKLGLITDCSPAVPLLWSGTPFAPLIDAPIFSCEVRLRKPAPRIYEIASERLGIGPECCVYVGDGSSDELRGASEAGMRAVLFACDYADTYDAHRPGLAEWRGHAVSRFENLLALVRSSSLGRSYL